MRFKSIQIENFKSLKAVTFRPTNFTVVVGPNAAGKSNLAAAFDFLSDAYRDGLALAVARKGGYENIAFRRQRRTKAAIKFSLEIELDRQETRLAVLFPFSSRGFPVGKKYTGATVVHTFSIRAHGEGIRSNFAIENEELEFRPTVQRGLFDLDRSEHAFSVVRSDNGINITQKPLDKAFGDELQEFLSYIQRVRFEKLNHDALLIGELLPRIARLPARTAVYQFSPKICRLSAAPVPEPRLSAYGENLPALIDWLQRRHPSIWKGVEQAMRDIVPGLEEITIEYLHTKTLGIFVKEGGFSRPWTAEDISDGTLQALAVLSALSDPRSTTLVVEEPENSVHPWITSLLVQRMKDISQDRTVIVTTHSPVVINLALPSEIWIAYKKDGHTELTPLTTLDGDVESDWKDGKYKLFEYLETGAILQAVPAR